MTNEKVFTVDEVSSQLRVPEDVVRQEIASGRLRANSFGGHIRILGSAFEAYLGASVVPTSDEGQGYPKLQHSIELRPGQRFEKRWPHKTGEEEFVEQYENVLEGMVPYRGKERHVRIGFTLRDSAGKRRRRSLVEVDGYPTVEFAAADSQKGGKMASIIRDRTRRLIPAGGTPPAEYQGLPIAPYGDVVVGPGASKGLAVVCDAADASTMVTHALIRCGFREDRA